jgi:hypothetical protein
MMAGRMSHKDSEEELNRAFDVRGYCACCGSTCCFRSCSTPIEQDALPWPTLRESLER